MMKIEKNNENFTFFCTERKLLKIINVVLGVIEIL